MSLIIVTGMSGSGKTVALKLLEDMGYYCIDNMPLELVKNFVDLATSSGYADKQMALGLDIRSGEGISKIDNILEYIKEKEKDYKILYLDSNDEALIKRYKETRRKHPLSNNDRLITGIQKEREIMSKIKEKSDYIMDTSSLFAKELKLELIKLFEGKEGYTRLFVTILSFGFMYGTPKDADLVFDVRFLPNPYYIEGLRMLTGEDKAVEEYVFDTKTGEIFLAKLKDMIDFLIPEYIKEGKTQLVIGIGCTGGQHRSVAVAKRLFDTLVNTKDIKLSLEHRDTLKNKNRIK